MVNKCLLLIMDGLGDRPIPELDNKTPLEYANTPNFDKLMKKSQCGLMYSLGMGKRPGSDTAHLSILGYPIEQYYTGRGPIEVAGLGVELQPGDIAFRGNFGTVDKDWNVIDRRAGRIPDVTVFAQAIDGIEIDGIKFIVKPGTAYRAGVVMRGSGLSAQITDADSHNAGDKIHQVQAKENTTEAKFTANVLNKFMQKAYDILKDLPENKEREKSNLLPANFLLLRGAGILPTMPKFTEKWDFEHACCIAGGGLYRGIGAFLGMELINVEGATAQVNTNIKGKLESAVTALKDHDFVFLHIKPTDSLGEDGNYIGKKDFIEKIDEFIPILDNVDDQTLIVITADHSTPCELKSHSADAVPILFCANNVRSDNLPKFSERECGKGSLGIITGENVMPQILNIMGKLKLIGT